MTDSYARALELAERHRHWAPPPEVRVYFFAMALGGEVGEIENLAKKEWRRGRGPDPKIREEMRLEVADALAYALMLAREMGIEDPLALMIEKAEEVERRPEWREFARSMGWET